eukprot:858011-Prymnesium_polylepis.2
MRIQISCHSRVAVPGRTYSAHKGWRITHAWGLQCACGQVNSELGRCAPEGRSGDEHECKADDSDDQNR